MKELKKPLQIIPVPIFLFSSGGAGKSHLVKIIYQVV